jgi:gas vesicle protein
MNLNTVKSNLSDLAASTLDHVADSLHHGQEALSDTTKTVSKDVSRTASKILHSDPVNTVGDKLATLGKVVAAASSVKAIASVLNPDVPMRWMLGAMKLQRRPSTFSRIATGVGLVAVGAAVGAGVAMLLTPKSGPQNRAALRRGLRVLQHDAENVVEQVESKARDVVEQVETRARDVVGQVEGKAQEVEATARGVIIDPADDAAKGTGGVGTTGNRPRTPGLSHRSPKT